MRYREKGIAVRELILFCFNYFGNLDFVLYLYFLFYFWFYLGIEFMQGIGNGFGRDVIAEYMVFEYIVVFIIRYKSEVFGRVRDGVGVGVEIGLGQRLDRGRSLQCLQEVGKLGKGYGRNGKGRLGLGFQVFGCYLFVIVSEVCGSIGENQFSFLGFFLFVFAELSLFFLIKFGLGRGGRVWVFVRGFVFRGLSIGDQYQQGLQFLGGRDE